MPTYQDGWRSFNYLFMVVYPADREAEVMNVLGPWADETWAAQHALELAEKDILTLKDNNLVLRLVQQRDKPCGFAAICGCRHRL